MAKIKKNERPTISRSLDRLFSVLSVSVPVSLHGPEPGPKNRRFFDRNVWVTQKQSILQFYPSESWMLSCSSPYLGNSEWAIYARSNKVAAFAFCFLLKMYCYCWPFFTYENIGRVNVRTVAWRCSAGLADSQMHSHQCEYLSGRSNAQYYDHEEAYRPRAYSFRAQRGKWDSQASLIHRSRSTLPKHRAP